MLGKDIYLDEVLEEVYLNAFENYPLRPPVPLGSWLEGLIDPSLRALMEKGEEEIENLRLVKEASPPE